ncbi:MAG TPA: hypothetical protein VF226_04860 [Hyphomicrobiaceae bacterium]
MPDAYIVLAIVVAWAAWREWLQLSERRMWDAERTALLNRLMSRSFGEYVQAQIAAGHSSRAEEEDAEQSALRQLAERYYNS